MEQTMTTLRRSSILPLLLLVLALFPLAALSLTAAKGTTGSTRAILEQIAERDVEALSASVTALTKQRPDENNDCRERLTAGSPWRAQFSMNAHETGRFLPVTGVQSFRQDGSVSNQLQLGPVAALFEGSYEMKGPCKMTLKFATVQPCLFGVNLPTLDLSNEAGPIRQVVERFLRGGKKKKKEGKTSQEFEKRPNTYLWHYVDNEICIARGSSGSVALWVSEKSENRG